MYCGLKIEDKGDIMSCLKTAGVDHQDMVEAVDKADRLEVWHTSFKDPGPDYNEFRLCKGETVLAKLQQRGY